MQKRPLSSLLLCGAIALVAAVAIAQEVTPTTPAAAPGQTDPAAQPAQQPPGFQSAPENPQGGGGREWFDGNGKSEGGSEWSWPAATSPGVPEKLPRLDEIIAEVLKSSPDVLVAEAQLQEAQAKLQQARMQAVQKATESYQKHMLAEKDADTAKVLLEKLQQQQESGTPTEQEVLSTQRSLAAAQAEVARYGTELRSQLGAGIKAQRQTFSLDEPQDRRASVRQVQQARPTLESITNKEIKEKLESSVTIVSDKNGKLKEPLSFTLSELDASSFADLLSGNYALNVSVDPELEYSKVTVSIQDVPLKTALLGVADSGGWSFIIRDYGIFITTRRNAEHISAPCIPENVPLYVPMGGAPAPTPAPEATPKP